MEYLFDNCGFDRLNELIGLTRAESEDVLWGFDFDGTLAPIVGDPAEARMSAENIKFLKEWSERARVVVVSGRSLSDLRGRLSIDTVGVIGNHGWEGAGVSQGLLSEAQATCLRWKQSWDAWRREPEQIRAFSNELRGVLLEDKGYSLSLHYRNARDPHRAEVLLREWLSLLRSKPKVVRGHSVFNLLLDAPVDKGTAFANLIGERAASVDPKQISGGMTLRSFYIGDDDTDEFVFRLRGFDLTSVRVGISPDSQAEFYLNSQAEVGVLLRFLTSGGVLGRETGDLRTGEP